MQKEDINASTSEVVRDETEDMGIQPPVPPEDIDTTETIAHVPSRATDEQFLARQNTIHAAVLECIHNLNSAASMGEKWKILEHMASSVFQCHSSHLYVIDATCGHLVRFASRETKSVGPALLKGETWKIDTAWRMAHVYTETSEQFIVAMRSMRFKIIAKNRSLFQTN